MDCVQRAWQQLRLSTPEIWQNADVKASEMSSQPPLRLDLANLGTLSSERGCSQAGMVHSII